MNLYTFQKEAVEKFFKSGSLLVAIPTGGGKTVVALEIIKRMLRKIGPKFRCLVIVPANLRSNFIENILKFKLNIPSKIITKVDEFNKAYNESNVIVISYNFLRMRYSECISGKHFDLVICDELHYAKNRNTLNFRVLWQLRQQTDHFLGLTASPIANTPEEFFSVLAIITNNKNIISQGMQLITYVEVGAKKVPIWKKWLFGAKDKKGQLVPVGIKDVEKFRILIRPWVYIPKMEKIEALNKRPKVRSFTLNVDLTQFEIKAYKYSLNQIPVYLRQELKRGDITDAELRKIRNTIIACQQTLLSPDYIYVVKNQNTETEVIDLNIFRPGSKIKRVGEYLKKTGEKAIVFSPFLFFGARLSNIYFRSIGIKSREYSGHVSPQDRKTIVNEFENGDLQVICLTGAGQEGINLPSCKHVIFLSLPWHGEILRQVMGRALRITSKSEFVNVLWVFALADGKETIDHWMSRIIKRKSIIRNVIFSALEEDAFGNVSAALPSYESPEKPILRKPFPS